MNDYILTASSTADLPKEQFEKLNIPYNVFHYNIDGEIFDDDLGETISSKEFYQKIKDGAQPTTSQPNVEDYKNFFLPLLKEGKDIIHVSLSSGLSGAVNSAQIAALELAEEFPNQKIEVIDSLGASSGYGLLITEAAKKRDQGFEFDQLVDWINENKLNLNHWFFSTDLTSYLRGGRISKTSYTLGNLLNIVPVLNMDKNGKLIPRKKVRGKNGAIKKLVKEMKDHAKNGEAYSGKVYICHSDSLKDAEHLAEIVEKEFPNIDGPVQINDIGTVIGSHTGPGTVALFFWGDERND